MKEQIFKVGDIVMFNDNAYRYMLRIHNTDPFRHILKNLLGKILTIKSVYSSSYSVYEDISRCVYPASFFDKCNKTKHFIDLNLIY